MASKVVQRHFKKIYYYYVFIIIIIFVGWEVIVKNTAYKLTDKNCKTWLKISGQN